MLASLAESARADCKQPETTQIIPLPVIATDPNEGNTYGGMPVFIHVCPTDKHTEWVLAPSVTWNSVIHITGTVRLFAYPRRDTTITVIAGASTRINYRVVASRLALPTADGAWTDESFLRIEHDAFARFFGLGPRSVAAGESTYTASHVLASERRGLNLGAHLNLGGSLGFDRENVLPMGVKGLPLAPVAFPDVPGMQRPSLIFWQGLDLRYDNRDGGDYAESGMWLDASVSVAEGLQGSPSFVRGDVEGRWIFPELSFISGAARVAYSGMSAANAPFYLQSTLGGAYYLRGFAQGRFYAPQAWTAELEQRIRAWRSHMMDVVADWQIDPFVTVGQVFDGVSDIVSRPRVAAGIGLRAFVHPNLVGRVDLAEGGEGLKIYVEIGFPY